MHRKSQGRNLDIFVVDDERLIADSIVAILKIHGYTAVAFSEPNKAIASVKRASSPKLLIADYKMPEMSGVELALQVNLLRPDSRIILFTGVATPPAELARLRDAGVDFTFIFKPISPDDLLRTVREHMG
jgi:FixJ family two-component response regulator